MRVYCVAIARASSMCMSKWCLDTIMKQRSADDHSGWWWSVVWYLPGIVFGLRIGNVHVCVWVSTIFDHCVPYVWFVIDKISDPQVMSVCSTVVCWTRSCAQQLRSLWSRFGFASCSYYIVGIRIDFRNVLGAIYTHTFIFLHLRQYDLILIFFCIFWRIYLLGVDQLSDCMFVWVRAVALEWHSLNVLWLPIYGIRLWQWHHVCAHPLVISVAKSMIIKFQSNV